VTKEELDVIEAKYEVFRDCMRAAQGAAVALVGRRIDDTRESLWGVTGQFVAQAQLKYLMGPHYKAPVT
jgi:hypothetical protein